MSVSSQWAWRRRTTGVLVCVLGAVGAATSATSALASGPSATAASAPRCTTAHLEIWSGNGEGGGTAGSTYSPIEFSNVGHHACTLNGYPGMAGFKAGHQVGPAASRNGTPHTTVTLAPGDTAHVILRVVDAGAVCSHPVTTDSLQVFPPGATRAQMIEFPFAACPHTGVLEVGPVHAGVGIPGFTTS